MQRKKPVEHLKLHGDYRADRHGDRAASVRATGTPNKPDGLSEAASDHWDFVVPQLVKLQYAKEIDTPALVLMCEWWSKWLEVKNTEGLKVGYKAQTMAVCHKQWRDLASRFGLTPSDRENLTTQAEQEDDPAAEFCA